MISLVERMFSCFVLFLMFSYSYSNEEFLSSYNNDDRSECPTDMDFYIFNRRIKRVAGGYNAKINSLRFVAKLFRVSYHNMNYYYEDMCGATVITERHLLTAAHCLEGEDYDEVRLNIGDYDVETAADVTNYIRKLKKVHLHPGFKSFELENDIAIIEINKPVPLGIDLRAVILPPQDAELSPGTRCLLWGWGRKTFYGNHPTVLQQVDLFLTTREYCQKYFYRNVTQAMICAGGREGQGSCKGDSGGSLLVRIDKNYVAYGIASFGRCGLDGTPGAFTNVPKYINWIYDLTKDADCKPRILRKKS